MQASAVRATESVQARAELEKVATESEKVPSKQIKAVGLGKVMLEQVVVDDKLVDCIEGKCNAETAGTEALACAIEYKKDKATCVVKSTIKPVGASLEKKCNAEAASTETLAGAIEYKKDKATCTVKSTIKPVSTEVAKVENETTTKLRSGGIYSIPRNTTKSRNSARKRLVDIILLQSKGEVDITASPGLELNTKHQESTEPLPTPAVSPIKKDQKQSKNFQWTSKDLRSIFPNSKVFPDTYKGRGSDVKKKASKAKQVSRDGLKQLRLFDLKVLGSSTGYVGEVAMSPSPPGAGRGKPPF